MFFFYLGMVVYELLSLGDWSLVLIRLRWLTSKASSGVQMGDRHDSTSLMSSSMSDKLLIERTSPIGNSSGPRLMKIEKF